MDPEELTPDEEKQIDAAIDADIEFWKETRNGRSEKVVQGLVDDSD